MMDEDSIVALNSVQGIEYVRPPTLDFLKVKENGDYTEYKIITKKNAREKTNPKKGCPSNPFTNYLDSFIFCKPTLNIKFPKEKFMKRKDGSSKFAYAIGMFPNPKNGKHFVSFKFNNHFFVTWTTKSQSGPHWTFDFFIHQSVIQSRHSLLCPFSSGINIHIQADIPIASEYIVLGLLNSL